jgi:phospholipase C
MSHAMVVNGSEARPSAAAQARKSLEDTWVIDPADERGSYDLEVFGPNGFFRSFKGGLAPDRRHGGDAKPEIRVRYDVHMRAITLSARNDGRRSLTLTVTANADRTDGPWRLHLPPGREQEKSWSVRGSGSWYDLTVASTSAGFERRCAGRLETGRDGVSGPAMPPTSSDRRTGVRRRGSRTGRGWPAPRPCGSRPTS